MSYFYKSVKIRCQRIRIELVLNSANEEFVDKDVPNAFVAQYEQFLGVESMYADLDVSNLFINKVLIISSTDMVRPFYNGEIKSAIFSFGGDKPQGPPICASKVDIQKAYDIVNWRFLGNILTCFGFHPIMIKWIMACVTSASFSLNVNGDIHGYFKGTLSVKYLGVPLISTHLLYKDCKVLVEKVQNRIGDWKNMSLSFARRLEL
ncbi:putative reverse transcriptase domain, reverse transcriptase zinc-binding domain protein, partial [Tanacetum coccineum]